MSPMGTVLLPPANQKPFREIFFEKHGFWYEFYLVIQAPGPLVIPGWHQNQSCNALWEIKKLSQYKLDILQKVLHFTSPQGLWNSIFLSDFKLMPGDRHKWLRQNLLHRHWKYDAFCYALGLVMILFTIGHMKMVSFNLRNNFLYNCYKTTTKISHVYSLWVWFNDVEFALDSLLYLLLYMWHVSNCFFLSQMIIFSHLVFSTSFQTLESF